ncbi:6-phosphogluconolactonase [Klebsiella pneumoniae]|uniref:6-phosphogluconolactonase n=1 Tax=Klebsiella pneumoniae TaxID=573 RepID=A0A447S3L1_KLEPN|nr:6-phosphogluconolactonase [Klebsiella pneumoniae]
MVACWRWKAISLPRPSPRGFNLDHSGKYLIAAGQKSHHIAVYDIVGEQGLLQEKRPLCGWAGPMWVVVNAH